MADPRERCASDHRWTFGSKSSAERLLDFFLCFRQNAWAAETFRGGSNCQ
jgi:hypothetical protein